MWTHDFTSSLEKYPGIRKRRSNLLRDRSRVVLEMQKKIMTPEWLEHPTFWSGVRRATIAPWGLCICYRLKDILLYFSLYERSFRKGSHKIVLGRKGVCTSESKYILFLYLSEHFTREKVNHERLRQQSRTLGCKQAHYVQSPHVKLRFVTQFCHARRATYVPRTYFFKRARKTDAKPFASSAELLRIPASRTPAAQQVKLSKAQKARGSSGWRFLLQQRILFTLHSGSHSNWLFSFWQVEESWWVLDSILKNSFAYKGTGSNGSFCEKAGCSFHR